MRHVWLQMPVQCVVGNIQKASSFLGQKMSTLESVAWKSQECEPEVKIQKLVPVDQECTESQISFSSVEGSPAHATTCLQEIVVNCAPHTDKNLTTTERPRDLDHVVGSKQGWQTAIIFTEKRTFLAFFLLSVDKNYENNLKVHASKKKRRVWGKRTKPIPKVIQEKRGI